MDRTLNGRVRPVVMGILNVTPDSFSDGGRHTDVDAALEHAQSMIACGADIVDVGGESTRPGAEEVDEGEETSRVIPVIEELARRQQSTPAAERVSISVDTTKAAVAQRALVAGASIINDISAMTHDGNMPDVARDSGAGVVIMHMRGTPRTMQDAPRYDDVVSNVTDYLRRRIEALVTRGIGEDAICVDPGIGFGKTVDHNLELLAGLDALRGLGRPVLVGLSRKSFIGRMTGRDVEDRMPGSVAMLSYCVLRGVDVVRVHDVRESADAINLLMATLAKEDEA